MGIDALHLGFDNINRIVKHCGAEACKSTSNQVADYFLADVLVELFGGVSVNDKPYSLVGTLLHKSGQIPLVNTT